MLRTLVATRGAAHVPLRALHTTRPLRLQNLFDTPERPPLAVAKLTPDGFHLSDGLVVPGGLVLIDGKALLWDVDPPGDAMQGIEAAWAGWTTERFRVFETVVPRPGKTVLPAPKSVRDYVSGLGIQLDVMDSRNAASTYNMLFEEGRTVAAALCPLKPIDPRTGGPR